MKNPKVWRIAVSISIPLAVGGAAALLSQGFESFKDLNKPPVSPPAWLFPVVWSLLYIAMGYASYRVYEYGDRRRLALTVYAVQLVINFVWPLLFFRASNYFYALICLIVLTVAVLIDAILFLKNDVLAGYIMLPYIIWCCFALYLNYGVYILN